MKNLCFFTQEYTFFFTNIVHLKFGRNQSRIDTVNKGAKRKKNKSIPGKQLASILFDPLREGVFIYSNNNTVVVWKYQQRATLTYMTVIKH